MASVSTYLNFPLKTEEAFNWYASIFSPGVVPYFMRFSEIANGPVLSEEESRGIMHASLEILGGHKLLATDMLKSMNHEVKIGNNTTINLLLDSHEDADRIYGQLSNGASEKSEMREEFWGYWGICLDKFGIRWMFNVPAHVL